VDGQLSHPIARPEAQTRGGDETILMVEDNPDVMETGAGILREQGYEIVQAVNAVEALKLIRGGLKFALLFSDIVMPGGINGVSLAHELRRLRPGTPVLLTTGWADRALDHEEERAGYDLIGKPYRRADLLRKVRLLLDGPNGIS
jgi:CheY-like chemotaxis protein